MNITAVFTLLTFFTLTLAEKDFCSSVPPSLWCSSPAIAQRCGFTNLCKRYEKSSRNEPVQITLLYEALCPGCQAFITEQLFPKIFKYFSSEFVQIELVPFGNAKVLINGSIQCQHGDDECSINKFESCLIDSMPDQKKFLPAIYCVEKQLKDKVEFADAAQKCFETLQIGMDVQTQIQSVS